MSGSPDLVARYRGARSDPTLAVLEGLHVLKHALRFGAELLDCRAPDPAGLRALSDELAPDVTETLLEHVTPIDPELYDRLSPAPHSTGVIALARRPRQDVEDVLEAAGPAPVVLLERPTHHGNIGAAVRAAAAAGAAGVLVTGRHDPWHAASLRGAAGLQFALPVASLEPRGIDALADTRRPIVALDPGGEPLGSVPLPPRSLLAFGSERTGVSSTLLDRAELRLALPMRPGVSSLNLATAVAVTLYVTTHSAPP